MLMGGSHLRRGAAVAALGLDAVVALAQGALAVVLGALARALGGAHEVGGAGPAMTSLSRWASRVPGLTGRSAVALSLIGLLLVVVRGLATVALARLEERAAFRAATDARVALLSAQLRGRLDVRLGDAVQWPREIEIGVRHQRARVRALAQLSTLAVVAVALDASFAGLLLLFVLPFALVLRPSRRALRSAQRAAAKGAVELVDATRDVVEHASLWASCGGGRVAVSRVRDLGDEGLRLSTRATMAQSFASASNEVLAGLAVVILVVAFAPGASEARPTLLPMLVTLVSAYRPLRDLAEAGGGLARAAQAEAAMARLGARSAPASEAPSTKGRDWPLTSLSLRGARLSVGGAKVRAGIDLDVAPGEVVALVGRPGAGKSALLEAIVGARPLAGGTLALGGERFDDATMGPSQRPVAWVPAAPPVLPGTLAENLSPDAPDDDARIERARAVLRALGDRVLAALPSDARLGPRGHRPSSGESQRLALARALTSTSPVLLLDEPTASLDAAGEALAIDAIREAARRRAVVLVSHRPAPLALARERVSLDDAAHGTGDDDAAHEGAATSGDRNVGPGAEVAC
jgi:ABC-type transport system involved in cytochrome bd biosynthesis fused ATPase/permease subunit